MTQKETENLFDADATSRQIHRMTDPIFGGASDPKLISKQIKADEKHWPHSPKHLISLAFDLSISECECSAQAFEGNDDPEFVAIAKGHRKTMAELKKLKSKAVFAIGYLSTPREGEHPDQWQRDLLVKHGAVFADSPLGWKDGIVQKMNELSATVEMMNEDAAGESL